MEQLQVIVMSCQMLILSSNASKERIMIVKTSKGYVVKSEKGKNLSKPYKTKQEAQERLNQVHYFSQKK